MAYRVLIVDDDAAIVKMLEMWLRERGYLTAHCADGAEVPAKAVAWKPDVILLDVLLRGADGLEVCARLKRNPATKCIPVIMMSGFRKQMEDAVTGLRGGAVDYLVKPFSADLLAAKLEILLRRCHHAEPEVVRERHGLKLYSNERRVTVGDKEIRLTRKEFDLLDRLMGNPFRILSPQSLLETVWGYDADAYTDPHTVEVHMSRLRRKLGKKFSSHIVNLIGSGYRLD
ncbi:MAG TPA: response regulator transcription factor [Elusimicrobiota bacterium]|nr:response regulator transcription factor [Elusimicrobiota bacterium]